MSKKPPATLYWVEVTNGKVGHNKRGGGKMSSLRAARDRIDWLRFNGADAKLYQSEPIEWKEVPEEES